MSNTGFAINDLLRRKLQTSLTIATLTLSVTATLFILFLSSRLGFNISSSTGTLTLGLNAIFGQFLLFIGVLVFVVGAILTSFISFLMMGQRTRDLGLIKAVGCPNSLIAGYFMTELLTVVFIGCVLGIVFGFVADFVSANIMFSTYELPNFLFAPLVFFVFFVLAVIFGLQPILKAAKMPPIKALSTANYYGLVANKKHKPLSKGALSWRIASRSMARRQSANIRIVILLSTVFILLTVSIAGGIIANNTTTSWVKSPITSNTIAIAHENMGNQYEKLLSQFSSGKNAGNFDYSDPNLAIPNTIIEQLRSLPSVNKVDTRLILRETVHELTNFTVDSDTQETFPVGDNRQGDSIIIGLNPDNLVGSWSVKGRFLTTNDDVRAVIGDSISHTMYFPSPRNHASLSDPLLEGITFQNSSFSIVGVCVDPLNNGFVTYVPLAKLESTVGIHSPNLLLVNLKPLVDQTTAISQIKTMVQTANPDLNVFEFNDIITANSNYLAANWQIIMLLPVFTLTSAALCLVGYMMLSAEEQRQEFGILRAVGAKPRIAIFVMGIQSILVLISSMAIGISLGTIITVLILVPQPVVTSLSIVEIAAWLAIALVGMFVLSLVPAFRIAKASILRILA